SDVEGMQKGRVFTLIETGMNLAYIPSDAADAICMNEEAVHAKTIDRHSWYVLCLSQANLSSTF
ncbi:hypothetical protein PAXRUDRAFT_118097, partial [Paxillus rubicundulus Ve08.2h10]